MESLSTRRSRQHPVKPGNGASGVLGPKKSSLPGPGPSDLKPSLKDSLVQACL